MRARRQTDQKPKNFENGMVYSNGTASRKSQLFPGGIEDAKSFERSITVPKKRKVEAELGSHNKAVRTSNESVDGNQRTSTMQEESDIPEEDSPGDGLYVNENSLEEPAENGSYEGNEQFYEKDELEDEDGGDD